MKHIHVINYVVLCSILIGGVATFWYVSPNRELQFTVGVTTSIFYVVWGLIHHAIHRDLRRKVMIEYLLMGAIAIVLLATILKV